MFQQKRVEGCLVEKAGSQIWTRNLDPKP
jgi:hypothetical protein